MIREAEKANRQGRESRIKVVEQSGSTVRDVLAKNYPWEYTTCDKLQCFPCSTKGEKFQQKDGFLPSTRCRLSDPVPQL